MEVSLFSVLCRCRAADAAVLFPLVDPVLQLPEAVNALRRIRAKRAARIVETEGLEQFVSLVAVRDGGCDHLAARRGRAEAVIAEIRGHPYAGAQPADMRHAVHGAGHRAGPDAVGLDLARQLR